MTQKERLVEIIKYYARMMCVNDPVTPAGLADYLLSQGVIVPPCKVGDTVYSIGWGDNEVHADRVSWFTYDSTDNVFCFQTQSTDQFTAEDIGKTIFFTHKEAEKALKERTKK